MKLTQKQLRTIRGAALWALVGANVKPITVPAQISSTDRGRLYFTRLVDRDMMSPTHRQAGPFAIRS